MSGPDRAHDDDGPGLSHGTPHLFFRASKSEDQATTMWDKKYTKQGMFCMFMEHSKGQSTDPQNVMT